MITLFSVCRRNSGTEDSHQVLNTEAWVRSQARPREICGKQSSNEQVFFRELCFPLPVSFHQFPMLIIIYMLLLAEGQISEDWEPSKQQSS